MRAVASAPPAERVKNCRLYLILCITSLFEVGILLMYASKFFFKLPIKQMINLLCYIQCHVRIPVINRRLVLGVSVTLVIENG